MRSGSTLLCRSLKKLEIAGDPKEYFHPGWKGVGLNRIDEPTQLYEHYNRVVKESTTPNGVFGIKMHWNQMKNALSICRKDAAFADKNDLEILQSLFPNPKFIFIWREDLLKQAVSTEIANQSNIWRVEKYETSPKENDAKKNQLTPLKFKPMQIYRHKQQVRKFNTQWIDFFSKYSIPYHEIKFESLTSNFNDEMHRVFRFLEIQPDCSIFTMATKKQSSRSNDRWAFYYRLIPEMFLQNYIEQQNSFRRSLSA